MFKTTVFFLMNFILKYFKMGAAEWAKLSEAERQLKKMQLRLRERQLRREGRYDEADALMGDAIKNQAALEIMMEAARKRQAQRLREQLELRKKRMNAGGFIFRHATKYCICVV